MDGARGDLTATVFSIQRMSTEDGPGIRTTVFFKGCGLNCGWCHNPESISFQPQIQWFKNRCIRCMICLQACPEKAIKHTPSEVIIQRDTCSLCGICTQECPANAIEMIGTPWELSLLIKEVLKDRVYFEKSGGGVTVSGGEPAMQADFVYNFLLFLKREGIHTAIDTSGYCNLNNLKRLVSVSDLILYDLKEINADKHKQFTSHSNELIFDNLKQISGMIDISKELWIRTPLIPGATASRENIMGIGKFISESLNGKVRKWELCAFNNLCRDKFSRMGTEWQYAHCECLTKDEMEEFVNIAKQSGVDPGLVAWSGSIKIIK